MMADSVGQIGSFRWGAFFGNLLLNVLHLGVWFAVLWLLLRFQWPHALGLAVVFWLVMTLAVVPQILDHARSVSQKPAATSAS
jgi:hypothetical protein